MSLRARRCPKHPSQLVIGVCSLCLTERLSVIADAKCALDSNRNFKPGKRSFSSSSARPSFATRDLHPLPAVLHHGSGFDSHTGSSFGGSRSSFSSATVLTETSPSNGSQSSTRKSTVKKDVKKPSRPHESVPTEGCRSMHSAEMPKMMARDIYSGGIIVNTSVMENNQKPSGSHNRVFAAEMHCSFSAKMSKEATIDSDRCSSSHNASSKKPSCSHNSAVAEDVHAFPSDEMVNVREIDKNRWNSHSECANTEIVAETGHTSIETIIPENPQMQSEISRMSQASLEHRFHGSASSASIGRETDNHCEANLFGVESTIEALKIPKDLGAPHSRASSSHCKKTTLSSLFILDDAEELSGTVVGHKCIQNVIERESSVNQNVIEREFSVNQNVIEREFSVNETPRSFKFSKGDEQRRCSRHRSLSERADPSKYLFPVPEDNKNPSWFSFLFRRIKRSPWTKSVGSMAIISEHQNEWQHVRQSWDAPRPSTWEQLRYSSLDGPTASSRPSWDGVIQFSSEDPVLNGIDFCIKGSREPMEGSESHLSAQAWTVPKRLFGNKRISSKYVAKAPHCDDNEDRTRPLSSTNNIQTISAQTTPPRLSESVEIFLQQRLNSDRRYWRYGKASNAVWSKVWAKTLSNPKWAFKGKHEKEQGLKDFDFGLSRSEDNSVNQDVI